MMCIHQYSYGFHSTTMVPVGWPRGVQSRLPLSQGHSPSMSAVIPSQGADRQTGLGKRTAVEALGWIASWLALR